MKNNKKGFTLAELLIVIAIMAILIAIAIPVFSAQLENAREAVDKSTARSANSLAYSEFMLNHPTNTEEITYTFGQDDLKNLVIMTHTATTALTDPLDTGSATAISKGKSQQCNIPLEVKVKNGEITANSWLEKLPIGD